MTEESDYAKVEFHERYGVMEQARMLSALAIQVTQTPLKLLETLLLEIDGQTIELRRMAHCCATWADETSGLKVYARFDQSNFVTIKVTFGEWFLFAITIWRKEPLLEEPQIYTPVEHLAKALSA